MNTVFNDLMKYLLNVFIVGIIFAIYSCQHDPLPGPENLSEDEIPGQNIDMDSDTVVFKINTKVCDKDSVYFNTQILPLFISNCAISGCHDELTAAEGVILTDYNSITKKIKPGDPNDSEYYTIMLKTELDALMPRKPGTELGFSLPQDQLDLIKDWIDQGAKDNYCDECDTTLFTFSEPIFAILERNCNTSSACHGAGTGNSDFTTYEGIYQQAFNIEQRAIIYKNMPPAGQLSDCDMLLLKKWIDGGTQND
ncbi:hypothetical protein ACFLU5_10090 [Bacteroidota bacterium]